MNHNNLIHLCTIVSFKENRKVSGREAGYFDEDFVEIKHNVNEQLNRHTRFL